MKYTTLPNTDIKVSKICLGTMTWGKQNTQEEGFEQMNYALEQGVNFFDTAELYPVPAEVDTYAETERITDYIDLYQLHWPERQTNFFGPRDYKHNPNDAWQDNFKEVLETLQTFVQAGKIKQIGISNEKSWGTMRYLEVSKTNNLPRVSTIQNPYSLLNRTFEGDLAELSIRENVGLLAYSPLASGTLSGKYIGGVVPKNSRFDLFPRFSGRYSGPQINEATLQYSKIAAQHNLSLAQMSLAFINQQPFLTSNIIGATQLNQLKENIKSIEVTLSQEIIDQINEVHNTYPNPAP